MYGVIDIGGTKTILCILDSNRQEVDSEIFATPNDYSGLLDAVGRFFKAHTSVSSIGVSTAGTVDGDRVYGFGPNINWGERNFSSDLQQATGNRIRIENDANCGALGEARYGAATDYERVLYITVSTGIGTGYVFRKKIPRLLAKSEGGKVFYYDQTGKPTKLEDMVSGQSIVRRFGQRADSIDSRDIWREIVHDLAPGLQALATILTPDVIVFGGSVGAQFPKYADLIDEFFQANPFGMPVPKFIRAHDTSRAVLLGAYELARSLHKGETIWI